MRHLNSFSARGGGGGDLKKKISKNSNVRGLPSLLRSRFLGALRDIPKNGCGGDYGLPGGGEC